MIYQALGATGADDLLSTIIMRVKHRISSCVRDIVHDLTPSAFRLPVNPRKDHFVLTVVRFFR